MEKVFVLADDHSIRESSMFPDGKVQRPLHPEVKHMLTVTATRGNEMAKRHGQLVVDEKFHDVCRTEWSACRAAYSMAARISSRSRKG